MSQTVKVAALRRSRARDVGEDPFSPASAALQCLDIKGAQEREPTRNSDTQLIASPPSPRQRDGDFPVAAIQGGQLCL